MEKEKSSLPSVQHSFVVFNEPEGDLFKCNFIFRLVLAVLTPPGNFPKYLNCTLQWGMVLSSSTLQLGEAYLLFDSCLWQGLFLQRFLLNELFSSWTEQVPTLASPFGLLPFLAVPITELPGSVRISGSKRCLTWFVQQKGQESKGGWGKPWRF